MNALPVTIYEYIKLDHRKVDHLFKQYEKSELKSRKKNIIEMILQELFVHLHSEQETLYAVLEKHYESRGEVLHGLGEHEEIEAQIQLIENATHIDSDFDKKVAKLRDLVAHHVGEEEGPLFKKAKEVLSDEETFILKEQMHDLKAKLLREIEKQIEKENKS